MIFRSIRGGEEAAFAAKVVFGTKKNWRWNLANNTNFVTGVHIAAFRGDRLVVYADCSKEGAGVTVATGGAVGESELRKVRKHLKSMVKSRSLVARFEP